MGVDGDGGPPAEINYFHVLWLAGMIAGAAYDCLVAVPGDYAEAVVDVLVFAAAATLLFCATHLRSNTARMLSVPFLAATVVELFFHEMTMDAGQLALLLMVAQLLAMTVATAFLFTRGAQDWFQAPDSGSGRR
jgi:hypothetical protein